MTREEMDAAIAAIDSYVERFPQELVTALWEARAWIEYGYESWHAMCEARGWTRRNVLTAPERREAVTALRQEGMSTRAIAAAVGASHVTVQNDLDAGGRDLPPASVVGTDGKTYQPTQPPRVVEPEVITAEEFVERYDADNDPDPIDLIPDDTRFEVAFWRHLRAGRDLARDLDFPHFFTDPMERQLADLIETLTNKQQAMIAQRRGLRIVNGGNA